MKQPLLAAGMAVTVLAALAWTITKNHDASSVSANTDGIGLPDTATLQQRLAEMERTQARQSELLQRRLNATPRPLSQAELAARQQADAHELRMSQDPAYARQVKLKQIAELDAVFNSEPVDQGWASVTSHDIASALASTDTVAENKGVECRSTRCRIRIGLDAAASPDDLLTPLMTALAGPLPHSRIVHLPTDHGTVLHIYADRGSAGERQHGSGG